MMNLTHSPASALSSTAVSNVAFTQDAVHAGSCIEGGRYAHAVMHADTQAHVSAFCSAGAANVKDAKRPVFIPTRSFGNAIWFDNQTAKDHSQQRERST